MNRRKPVQLSEENETIEDIKRDLKLQKKRQRQIRRKRFIKRVFILLIFVASAYGIYVFDQSDISRVQTVKITGQQFYEENEILDAIKLKKGDRLISNLPFMVKQRVKKLPLVENANVNVYYNKGYLSIEINEVKAVAYGMNDEIKIYFSNGEALAANDHSFNMISQLPLLQDFEEETISKEFLKKLGDLPEEAFLAISEIYSTPKELDPGSMKMVMNDEYFVYLSIETLPMLSQYATLVNGANENNKCIDMIEYGPTDQQQTAIVRRCE